MLHIHLFPKSPQSPSVISNSTFLLTHPYKASLPLYSVSSIHHLPFLSLSRIPFTWSLHLHSFVRHSSYTRHRTPIIHSHSLISFHLLLSVSCHSLSFIYFLALNHLKIFAFSLSTHFLCHCRFQFLSYSLCASL